MKSIFYTSLILAGFLFSGSDACSQSKFAVSANVTPFLGHSKTTVDVIVPDSGSSGTFTTQRWTSEASPKGIWIGLNGRFSFSKKWSASTGLWYGYYRIKATNVDSRSHTFSIPLVANLQTSDRKLSPYFSAGAFWNFATTSRLTIPDIGTVTFKSDENTSRISPTVGAGVIYHFAQRLSLIAQPTFTYAIPPSNMDTKAYQVGLNLQLMVKL
ncbi:PorT family protein [Dyadobacter chenwenxiniae]|uniref:PorT family protein n=1 Tax=Dyadobacter chenwenxiniae TaxID=2906456 RepID=A0A9X1TGA0_9BACT|nr:outer membrane beta-barrel protein [Dyadobacter chenwenxiniae]MCF0065306.1 PorT family protein [Dyadobacter chenwenxiniae]UON84426.1 PorT family protein [Dyadobacter chenwenxiniae]